MKILLVTGSINQGGAEFQLLALADLLQRRGMDIEVLALTDHSHYLPYIKEKNIRYSCISNKGNNFQRILRSVKAIRKAKPALVISYIRATSLVAILSKMASFFRFKLIISERTALILPRYDLLYFNLALSANAVTVNSKSKVSYINKRFPYLKKRIFFIPNIINFDKFRNIEKVNSNSSEVRISYVGRISPEKNLLNLVRAIDAVERKGYKISLSLHGAANNKRYHEEMMLLIKELQLENTVQYKGPTNDVGEVYKNTDLLCLVSIFEGFSNVVSEAISSGVPVLASDIEENRFLVEDGINGFLADPGSYESIAAGIEKFLRLTDAQKSVISANNKAKAQALFDEEKIYRQYLGIFKQIGVS